MDSVGTDGLVHKAVTAIRRAADSGHGHFITGAEDPIRTRRQERHGRIAKADFTALRDQLATVKGKWLVSINDVPEIRALFKGFEIKRVSTKYSIASSKSQQVSELLIANYPLIKAA